MFIFKTGLSGADHEAAVRKAGVVALHLLHGNEMHGRVVIREIVRHLLDLLLNAGLVGTFLGDHEDFAGVHLAGHKLRLLACADARDGILDRDRVLAGIDDALDAADRVRVALGDAAAPEGVVFAVREAGGGDHAEEREHARIPAAGDEAGLAAFLRGGVDRRKMLRNARVRIEAVDHVEILCVDRGLDRQVGRAAAAEDKDVDLILPCADLIDIYDRDARGPKGDALRGAPREDGGQFHIFVLADGALDAPP